MDNISIKVVAGNVKLFIYIILCVFLMYILGQKFNKLAQNIIWKLKNHQLMRDWIYLLGLTIKSFSQDRVGIFRILVNYFSAIKDTPHNIWAGFFTLVYVNKPDDLQTVLNNSNALEKSDIYKFLKSSLGVGLITAPVSKWKKKRRQIAPLFSAKFVENHLNVFNFYSSELVEKLKNNCDTNEYFDLWSPVLKSALTIIWAISVGKDGINENEKESIIFAINKISELYSLRIYSIWLFPQFMYNLYVKMFGYQKYLDFIACVLDQTIENKKQNLKQTMELIKKHGEDAGELSYMDRFLRQREEGTELTDKEIMYDISTIVVAGSETNALTISFTLFMWAMNLGIQEKVYEEIIKFSGQDDTDVTVEQVQQMTFLEQCILETLRLYPSVPIALRKVTETFQINDNFTVQENSNVIIPIYMVHRNPNIYPNPLQYNPDNFTPDRVEGRHKYSFLGFGGGPRGCIGDKYAMLAIKIALIKILKNYRFETHYTKEDIQIAIDIVLRNASGFIIKMFSREKKNSKN